jgi:lipopolysaccharide biosynthesis glycosyltransferase
MLTSLKEHLDPSYRPIIHVVSSSVEPAQLREISRLVEATAVAPSTAQRNELPRSPRFVADAALPLLLADLLPQHVDRVLFLDADALVLDDVSTLWETNLENRTLAAAVDMAIPLCSSPRALKRWRDLGVPEHAPYFNAGVMLVNLVRWRELNVPSRANEYLTRNSGAVDFLHQEALNAVLWNDWHQLDQRWNLVASLSNRDFGPYEGTVSSSPGIVHFAGRFKPWRLRSGGPFDELYCTFLEMSGSAVLRNQSLREKLLSLYDCHMRRYFYGLERALWNRGMI